MCSVAAVHRHPFTQNLRRKFEFVISLGKGFMMQCVEFKCLSEWKMIFFCRMESKKEDEKKQKRLADGLKESIIIETLSLSLSLRLYLLDETHVASLVKRWKSGERAQHTHTHRTAITHTHKFCI